VSGRRPRKWAGRRLRPKADCGPVPHPLHRFRSLVLDPPRPAERRRRWVWLLILGLPVLAAVIVVDHQRAFARLEAEGVPVEGEVTVAHVGGRDKFDHSYADIRYERDGLRHVRLQLGVHEVPRRHKVTLLVDPVDPDHVMIHGVRQVTDGYEASLLLLGGLWAAVVAIRVVGAVRRRTPPSSATDRLASGARRPAPGDTAA
jgi:hypothetical protein